MPANHCVQAAEQQGWTQAASGGRANGRSTLQFEMNCLHHQASLAKKPSLLAIDGLCSSMVRFARAMRSSKFQDLFTNGLDEIAGKVNRRTVETLPATCVEWMTMNSRSLDLLSDLSDEQKTMIVQMFNGCWSDSFEEERSWVHFCSGCCDSHDHTVTRARECLRILFETFPQVPLLYRWKGWEPCQSYVGIGVLLHGFLPYLVKRCCDPKNVDKVNSLLEQDEDHADFSYALRQEVRISKTLKFVTSDSIKVSWFLHVENHQLLQ